MNKAATWVLTDTRQFGLITFTCSACGRTVNISKYFDTNGHYDMKTVCNELIEDYPYCHCGAKMKKDTQIESKMSQMKKAHRLAVETWLSENPVKEKTYWKVDEVV